MTKKEYTRIENEIIYQVSVHNCSEKGTFLSLIDSLDKIQAHGADYVYLLPFYLTGTLNKKGNYGSPYCIKDYCKVNPCLGTMEDLDRLIDAIHGRGMKVMIDIVFRHTSQDSILVSEHPEFYYRNQEGNFYTSVPEWNDIIDLNTEKKEVQDYLLDVLSFYRKHGVDAFRFDVASVLPYAFIQRIRALLGEEVLLLAESCGEDFNCFQKQQNRSGLHPLKLFSAGFDLCYHYSNYFYLKDYLLNRDKESLYAYKVGLESEFATIPDGKFIVRCLENHDMPRICSFTKNENIQKSLLAFSFFTHGPAFVLYGEEYKEEERIDFCNFTKVSLAHGTKEYFDFYQRLVRWKKTTDFSSFQYSEIVVTHQEQLLIINYYNDHKEVGLFPLSERDITFDRIPVKDGTYLDVLSDEKIVIEKGSVISAAPMILYIDER